MEVLQVASELKAMLSLYHERKPKRVLEIGTWDGGTLKEWLSGSPDLVVAIDESHRNAEAYEDWRNPKTNLVCGVGLSQDESMVKIMQDHAPYDWVFIDGDHTAEKVEADAENTGPMIREGGLMLFHDIAAAENQAETGPKYVFDKLCVDHKNRAIIRVPYGYPYDSAHGIGIIEF